jgi:lipopolysaccharide export system permease protein
VRVPTLGVLDRWLAGRFLRAYLTFASSVVMLFVVIDAFNHLDSLTDAPDLLAALKLRYGTQVPELLLTLAPYVTLLAALWVVASLLRNNELVPLIAGGYSPQRIALPLLLCGAALAPLTWLDREVLLPQLSDWRRLASGVGSKDFQRPRPVPDGQGGVLSARYYIPATRELHEVVWTRLDAQGAEQESVFAVNAVYQPWEPESPGGWRFQDGWRFERTPDGQDTLTTFGTEGLFLESRIVPEDVEASIDASTYMSAKDIRRQLRRTPGFRHLEVQLHERFTFPVAGVALLLVCLPITLAGQGGWDSFVRFLVCLGVSLGFFVLSTLSSELGSREVLSPAAAAWGPLGVFGVVGLSLGLRLRV